MSGSLYKEIKAWEGGGESRSNPYRRYDIVAGRVLADAVARMERYLGTVKPPETGRSLGKHLGTPSPEEDQYARRQNHTF